VRPMSFIAAALWACGAHVAFIALVVVTSAFRENAAYDLIGQTLGQVVAYSLALYLLLRNHAPNARIRDFIAVRATNSWFLPLALILGVSATFPTLWLIERIDAVYPPPEELITVFGEFAKLSQPEKIAAVICIVAVGPFVEEMLFRGALYRSLIQDKAPMPVVMVTALYFAAVHLNPYRIVPLFLMGCLLGYVRWASGSLWPSFLLHLGFNALPFVDLFWPLSSSEETTIPIAWVAAGAGTTMLVLLFVHALARSSRRASAARRSDV
jgi:membrane protease YdiL (CAAX protease family)